VYQALLWAVMIDPADRDLRARKWRRWERGASMELWPMDVAGGGTGGRGESRRVRHSGAISPSSGALGRLWVGAAAGATTGARRPGGGHPFRKKTPIDERGVAPTPRPGPMRKGAVPAGAST
jgi:hypothetical protein